MLRVKFGKRAPKLDRRNLRLSLVLKAPELLPPIPDSFSIDQSLNASIKPEAYGNKTWGDCVIASRAIQTLRLEYIQQKRELPITTEDCLREYWKEQRGWLGGCLHPDNGLVLLDSLKLWRQNGWFAANDCYTIHAFAAVDLKRPLEIRQGIYFLGGVQLGVQVPKSALDQVDRDEPWTVTNPDSTIVGGHCIALFAYDEFGVASVSWGVPVRISWEWLRTYSDEAYCVVDSRRLNVADSPVDEEKLEGYLEAVTG